MHSPEVIRVALLGNPNSGKSSVFNHLTGLRQKVGNYPGVTVEKKLGALDYPDGFSLELVDLPGAYSLYTFSRDERMVVSVLADPKDPDYPDVLVYIANSAQLEKHLLLFTQLRDLGLPLILGLNMADIATDKGLEIDPQGLAKTFQVPVVSLNGRTGAGIAELKDLIRKEVEKKQGVAEPFYRLTEAEAAAIAEVRDHLPEAGQYQALLIAHHQEWLPFIPADLRAHFSEELPKLGFHDLNFQVRETMARFDKLEPMLQKAIRRPKEAPAGPTDYIDRVLTHFIWGPLIFFGLMFLVFQAIFAGAAYPMDWIEQGMGWMGENLRQLAPEAWWMELLTDGILAGLGGILVFIPQIAILFFLISLLEEVGYMARAVFLFDNLMNRFGLNGRSIVALISGGACAVPAIMSTRTISNWKERLITILVTPLISCSARIPVYTLLISFAVPPMLIAGVFNLQGLAFMGLYLIGIASALGSALVFKWILKTDERSFLLLEMPDYKPPVMRNVFLTVYEKVKAFSLEAGKIILGISIVLWLMSSFGPGNSMAEAEKQALQTAEQEQMDETQTADLVASRQIEASFAGRLGKWIEPAIEPLGFDWKIGIALITSFAAREVFVSTMATIYSIGSADSEYSVRDRLLEEKDPVTGEKVYNFATALSLLIFYVFALQCMSTLAVVRRETRSWKWPIIQFLFMGALAYLGSLLVYQIFG